jgi:ATP-binding cassette subfamily B protein RaxB
MIECAQIAGVHDEIMAMPMSYNSLIGDMGSSLSSGQKQRVLLARALYRRPKTCFWTRVRHIWTPTRKKKSMPISSI